MLVLDYLYHNEGLPIVCDIFSYRNDKVETPGIGTT